MSQSFLEWLKSLFKSLPVQCNEPIDSTRVATSVILILGILLSYLLQSSEGLSPWYLFLGSVSMIAIFANTTLLAFERFICCANLPVGHCIAGLMSWIQVATQSICFYVLVILFYIYYPKERRVIVLNEQAHRTAAWKESLAVGIANILFTSLTVFGSLLCLVLTQGPQPAYETELWADVLGFISLIVSLFQFIPQIVATWKLNSVGPLSIPTLLMQAPGSFLVVYTLAADPNTNVTTWVTFLVTGLLQTFLLGLCIYYLIRDRKAAVRLIKEDDETTALLASEQPHDSQKGSRDSFHTLQAPTIDIETEDDDLNSSRTTRDKQD